MFGELDENKSGYVAKVAILIILSLGLALGHFQISPDKQGLHQFLFKLAYLPIILAGSWFGLEMGIIMSLFISFLSFAHIQAQLSSHSHSTGMGFHYDLFLYLLIGVVTGYLSTLRSRSFAELTLAQEELSRNFQLLKEKTVAIMELEKELEHSQRLKLLGEMGASLAHEIRTPLMGIEGALAILRDSRTNLADREEFLGVIEGSIDRITKFVDDFLNLAASEPRVEKLLIEELIRENLTLLKAPLNGKNIKVVQTHDFASPIFETNGPLLTQIISNLLLNAIDASSEGGKIHIRAEGGDGRGLTIQIRDFGKGISPELRDRIFTPFFTTKSRGTGLGLAICRRIIHNLKGTLEEIPPEDGEGGARFKIWLPQN